MEAAAMALEKYSHSDQLSVRKNQKTRRHLIEFWMIEPEMAFMHQEESLEVQEQYVAFLVQNVLDHCDYALDVLERDKRSTENLYKITIPTYLIR